MHDSHIHLTTQPLSDYQERALENFVQKGGKHILNCGNSIETSLQVLETYEKYKVKYPNLIQNAIGIHPENYHPDNQEKNFEQTIEEFKNIVEKNKIKIHAIGETGLEYYNLLNRSDISFEKKEETIEIQKKSFREHIKVALDYNLPMTIHSRDEKNSEFCTKDLLDIFLIEGKTNLKGSMHSYTGNEKFLPQIIELGLCIGFNAIITYKNGSSVREILKKTPVENILFETDAPFLPTDSVRKNKKATIRFGQPSDILEIAKVAGEIKDMETEKILEITNENYKRVFQPVS